MSHWDGLFGQEHVRGVLDTLIDSNKIPHAFLFAGIEGAGKYFTALKFAQAINIPVNNQEILKNISELNEPYIKFIFPLPRGKNETESSGPFEKLTNDDIQIIQEQLSLKKNNPYHKISIPKANLIKISSVRDIKKFLTYNYQDILFRIILISDAHLMNEESQNALLKNLEEPPAGIIFILTTPYPMLLRETIRSRCWQINFQPLDVDSISSILTNYFSINTSEAQKVAAFANGSVDFALKLIASDISFLLEKTVSILRYSFGKKTHSALKEINTVLEDKDPELFRLLVQLIITWLNDVLKHRVGLKDLSFIDHKETIDKFNTKFPNTDIHSVTSKLEYFVSLLKNNVNQNIISLNLVYALESLVTSK